MLHSSRKSSLNVSIGTVSSLLLENSISDSLEELSRLEELSKREKLKLEELKDSDELETFEISDELEKSRSFDALDVSTSNPKEELDSSNMASAELEFSLQAQIMKTVAADKARKAFFFKITIIHPQYLQLIYSNCVMYKITAYF